MLQKPKSDWLILVIAFGVMAFASLVIYLRYQDATFGVKVSSASAWSDTHARLVAEFVTLSNSLPNSVVEVSEYIIGGNSNYGMYYKTVNISTKQFLIGQRIDSKHTFEAIYQISNTGLIRQSSQVVQIKTQ